MARINKEEKELLTEQAVNYRMAKLSYAKIARKLNIGTTTAFKLVKKAMAKARKNYTDGAAELIIMEAANLDRMEVGLYEKSGKGDSQAINTVLRIKERRSKLLGLDAPVKQHIEMELPEPIQFVIG